jgi:VIT1/CCC1 family predicted Fe2+/Mn2+ transporter
MSMATGEYVSVHSQQDLEEAALAEEREELESDARGEHDELVAIYVRRGLEHGLAEQVATQLTAHDALAAHARDELGISQATTARPLQAALASAVTFTVGAAAPLIVVLFAPAQMLIPSVAVASLLCLAVLGALGAKAGGAPYWPSVWRVSFWGALAMVVTAVVGKVFGAAVG